MEPSRLGAVKSGATSPTSIGSSNSESVQKPNEDDLLIDIYSLNNQETDTVRLDASTIKQLFEDTDYKLDDVRKKKLVKPVALTLLPNEIKKIESTKKRKELLTKVKTCTEIIFS